MENYKETHHDSSYDKLSKSTKLMTDSFMSGNDFANNPITDIQTLHSVASAVRLNIFYDLRHSSIAFQYIDTFITPKYGEIVRNLRGYIET